MAENNIKVLTIKVDTGTGEIKVNGITSSIRQATAATKEFTNISKDLGNELDKNRNKSGLAGAAVVEIGRTISDANYGFAAMANNISQLTTLMITLISTSGGVKAGFKELGKAFSGPLGILVAFQVAITLLEKFSKSAKATENAFDGISKASGSAGNKLVILKKAVDDSNISLEEKKRAVAAANAEYEGLNARLDENGKLTNESVVAIDKKIDAMKRLAKANAYLKEIEKLYGELAVLETKTTDAFTETINSVAQAAQFAGVGAAPISLVDTFIETNEEAKGKVTERIDALFAGMAEEELIDEIFTKNKKKGYGRRERDFKQHLIDLSKIKQSYDKEALQNDYLNETQKLNQEEFFATQELQLEKYRYIQKERERLANYLNQTKDAAKRQAAIETFNKQVEDAEVKHQETLRSLRRSFANQRREMMIADSKQAMTDFADFVNKSTKMQSDFYIKNAAGEEKRVQEFVSQRQRENEINLRALKQRRTDLENEGKSTLAINQEIANQELKIKQDTADGERKINIARIRDNQEVARAILDGLTSVTNFIDSEFQRQLDIEQNKTTSLNNELRERLNNEELSKDERKRIQGQIAANDEKLRVTQEKIEKKRFQMNKAANIATATINTYLAATDVLAREKLGVVGKIAAMTLVIGSGLLQVAAIARQQFVSSANAAAGAAGSGGGGGGGGAGTEIQAPDFNIVGASPSNQLAAAVQGQFQQPVKAYVVAKDVSTAQELDRNAVSSASLG